RGHRRAGPGRARRPRHRLRRGLLAGRRRPAGPRRPGRLRRRPGALRGQVRPRRRDCPGHGPLPPRTGGCHLITRRLSMAKYTTEDIRNLALAGHRASGKTSLADALLFQAKAVERKGSVDDGTSVADADEEAKHHRFSIDAAVLHLDYKGKHLNLIDAPGAPDFVGAALGALNAVETAVIVVSAVNGAEVNTRRMFNEAGKRGLARVFVINKIDHENVHFPRTFQ